MLRNLFSKIQTKHEPQLSVSSQEYWTEHNVTNHTAFRSREESLHSFKWRTFQYMGLLELMPVNKASGKVVLDYGCGPGHDLVGFIEFSSPSKIIGMDVSSSSLEESRSRLLYHNRQVELIKIDENETRLPLEDNSIDIINCSGVLHHTPDPARILREFSRILKSDGSAQIMVYNYDSLWMHLYTAFITIVEQGLYPGMKKLEVFSKLTDGPNCPISHCYKPQEFIDLSNQAGFFAKFSGAAVSSFEMSILPRRYDALQNLGLDDESREFLYSLRFDERGLPTYQGNVAGVDGCYRLTKR